MVKATREVPTVKEMENLIFSAKNQRDRALLAIMYWTGRRVSEVLNVTMNDVKFTKTAKGENIVLVKFRILKKRSTVKYINTPFSFDSQVSLAFIDYYKKLQRQNIDGKVFVITPQRTWKIIKKYFGREVNNHWFRHCRATHLATVMTALEMTAYFGWASVNTALRYIHSQPEFVLDKMRGLEE